MINTYVTDEATILITLPLDFVKEGKFAYQTTLFNCKEWVVNVGILIFYFIHFPSHENLCQFSEY